MSRRVLVIGDVMADVIVIPDGPIVKGSDRTARIRTRPGGSGANQAVWLGAMGVDVTLVARVGQAEYGIHQAYFHSLGITPMLAADPDLPSGTLVCMVDPDGERSFLTDRGANLNLCAADLPDQLLDGLALVVISGYALFAPGPREAVQNFLMRAKARGVAIAVDPASEGFLRDVGPANFVSWTKGADWIFANRDEAEVLSGGADLAAQMQLLGSHYTNVVIKLGGMGAAIGDKDGVRLTMPAQRVAMVDSTGAGDAFAAGFVAAYVNGASLEWALTKAIEAGALAVQSIGGQPG